MKNPIVSRDRSASFRLNPTAARERSRPVASGQPRPKSASSPLRRTSSAPLVVRTASVRDRPAIYKCRHTVYARELGQHTLTPSRQLSDSLDEFNTYLIAEVDGEVAGFISVTPPTAKAYSVDKYFPREELGVPLDELYEVRLLTVLASKRGQRLAALLMYAAFRWVESRGGRRIIAIGRQEILEFYRKAGLIPVGRTAQAGAVTYELLQADVANLRRHLDGVSDLIARLGAGVDWRLPMPFRQPAPCFHGGAFFDAIGDGFEDLERRRTIINADVLDAWFPPSPKVLVALHEDPEWLLKTSPPTACGGLVRAIAQARGVRPGNILPGAGSSDLIFRVFREWLNPASRVVLMDPTYGEYSHVLERVIGCHVIRVPLEAENGFRPDLDHLARIVSAGCDLLVLVNPNSPTGDHVARAELARFLHSLPSQTRVWIDETYVDYVGPQASLESIAAASENVLICKSMSKVYALSGMRVAYLCAGSHQLESLRAITPPWIVGLPAQLAAVRALDDPDYYLQRYQETHRLRQTLARDLESVGLSILPGCANFLLGFLPADGASAAATVARCRSEGVFLRDAGATSRVLGSQALRVAVKTERENQRIVDALRRQLPAPRPGSGTAIAS